MRTLRLAGSDLAHLDTMVPSVGDSVPMDVMFTDGDFSSAESMQRIVELLARNVVALTLLRCVMSDTTAAMLFKVRPFA
jgi:hypothetical protein